MEEKKNLRRRASVLQSLGFVYCMLSSNLDSFLHTTKKLFNLMGKKKYQNTRKLVAPCKKEKSILTFLMSKGQQNEAYLIKKNIELRETSFFYYLNKMLVTNSIQ